MKSTNEKTTKQNEQKDQEETMYLLAELLVDKYFKDKTTGKLPILKDNSKGIIEP